VPSLRRMMANLGSQTEIVCVRSVGYRMICVAESFVTCRMSEAEYAIVGPILAEMRATGIKTRLHNPPSTPVL
jgi:hypothetical protein